jgi:hypothetical protein
METEEHAREVGVLNSRLTPRTLLGSVLHALSPSGRHHYIFDYLFVTVGRNDQEVCISVE